MPTKMLLLERAIGKRLKERRQQLGLSRQYVANLLGITGQQIHKYESGIDRIPASRLFELGRFLSVPVAFFYDELEKCEESAKEILVTCVGIDNKQFIIKLLDLEGIISEVRILERKNIV